MQIKELQGIIKTTQLDALPDAVLLDLYLSCQGISAEELTNIQLYQAIDAIEALFNNLATLSPTTANYYIFQTFEKATKYTLKKDITLQPFIKYYLYEKVAKNRLKNKNSAFEEADEDAITLLCSIFLHETNAPEDFFDFEQKQQEASLLEQKLGAVQLYKAYNLILSQLSELPELYPYYYGINISSPPSPPHIEAFYEKYALEMQLEYIAKINHCKIEDVYFFTINDVMTHIGIINKKTELDYAKKSSRNI